MNDFIENVKNRYIEENKVPSAEEFYRAIFSDTDSRVVDAMIAFTELHMKQLLVFIEDRADDSWWLEGYFNNYINENLKSYGK